MAIPIIPSVARTIPIILTKRVNPSNGSFNPFLKKGKLLNNKINTKTNIPCKDPIASVIVTE